MISAIILARNEANNIVRCIESLKWCDEVIVVDDGSTDGTETLATQAGARVVQHAFENFASQRNWAMTHAGARGDWVLHLDADEVSTPSFEAAVVSVLGDVSENCIAMAICRKTILDGCWLKYSDGFPVYIMRLVRSGLEPFQSAGHGEIPVPLAANEVLMIRAPLIHYAFSKGLENWISRHNRYSSHEAKLETASSANVPWRDVFHREQPNRRAALRSLSRRCPGRPLLRFFYQYVWKLGFLDGRVGLKYCLLMATYEWWITLKASELRSSSD